MKKMYEGLQVNDLEGLILPVVTIDEYESKIDSDAIVVGFYVNEQKPAEDLSIFIENGSGDLLDTEVSPAPNDDGKFLLFVEFIRDDKFPKSLEYVIESVKSLTSINDWYFTAYENKNSKFKLTTNLLEEKIRLEPNISDEEKQEQNESIEFFKDTVLDDLKIHGNKLIFIKGSDKKVFERIAFGPIRRLFEYLDINDNPIRFDSESLKECRHIRNFLGDHWDVNKLDNQYVIANNKDERIMVIK